MGAFRNSNSASLLLKISKNKFQKNQKQTTMIEKEIKSTEDTKDHQYHLMSQQRTK